MNFCALFIIALIKFQLWTKVQLYNRIYQSTIFLHFLLCLQHLDKKNVFVNYSINWRHTYWTSWRTVVSDEERDRTRLSDFGQFGRRYFFVPTLLLSTFVSLFLYPLPLFLCLISILLFSCASVRENTRGGWVQLFL